MDDGGDRDGEGSGWGCGGSGSGADGRWGGWGEGRGAERGREGGGGGGEEDGGGGGEEDGSEYEVWRRGSFFETFAMISFHSAIAAKKPKKFRKLKSTNLSKSKKELKIKNLCAFIIF